MSGLHLERMRRTMSYFLMVLALGLGGYLSWRFTQPELVGHWHVSHTLGTDGNSMSGIYHFNVYADGEVRVNEVNEGEYLLPGHVDKAYREIHFGGECWYVGANYRVWGSRMDLRGRGSPLGEWRAVAFRAETGDCDLERDYFADLPFAMRLPRAAASNALVDLPEDRSYYALYLGTEDGGSSVRFLADRYHEIERREDLKEMIRRAAAKVGPFITEVPEALVLYQDVDTEATEALAMLRQVFGEGLGWTGYYRVYRDSSAKDVLRFGCKWVAF